MIGIGINIMKRRLITPQAYRDYLARVAAGSGVVDDTSITLAMYRFLSAQGLAAGTELLFDSNAGFVQRIDGVLKYIRTGFDLSSNDNDLDGSETATVQPRLVGGLAPNSKVAAANQNGEARYFTHTPISFAAGDAWSVTTVINWDGSAGSSEAYQSFFGRGTPNNTKLDIEGNGNATQQFRFTNSTGQTTNEIGSNLGRLAIGKRTVIHLIAEGNTTIKLYINGVYKATPSVQVATNAVFSSIIRGYGFENNRSFNGKYFYHRLQSGAMTAAQALAEATFLSTKYPEIESTKIGSQIWSTRNFEAVATPMGNVIANVPTAGAVEKITNAADREFSSDTGFWTKGVGHTIGSNVLAINTATTTFTVSPNVAVLSKWYKITITIINYTSGAVTAYLGNAVRTPLSANGTYIIYNKTTSDPYFYIQAVTGGFVGDVDNVSIQELNWSNATEIYDAVYAATSGTTAQKEYAALKEAAMWCYYNNSADNGAIYGKLYNWYAAKLLDLDMVTAGFGWRVPTSTQFTTLQTALGGNLVAGGKLKMTGTSYWAAPNMGADNSSGFTALGGGYRNNLGTPTNYKGVIAFGTSTTNGTYFTTISLSNASDALTITAFENLKTGVSLRLIRE